MSSPGLEAWRYRTVVPVELYLGDARQVLAEMPDASVDCVATSPPFWALRDYGTGGWADGDPGCSHHSGRDLRLPGTACRRCPAVWADPQQGLEPTVEKYVDRLVAVFDELARVLKSSGTCWLNLGDRHTGGPRRAHPLGAASGGAELPDKQLVGVPWRVAFALQTRGWILFSEGHHSFNGPNLCVSAAQRLMDGLYGLQWLWCKFFWSRVTYSYLRIRRWRAAAGSAGSLRGAVASCRVKWGPATRRIPRHQPQHRSPPRRPRRIRLDRLSADRARSRRAGTW